MKKWIALLLAAVLMVSMAACTADTQQTTEATEEISETSSVPGATEGESELPEIVTEPGASDPGAATEPLILYTVKINRPDYPVFDGPGYDYFVVATVEEAGEYTIVSEETDGEGNLWGKLKSGLGWVDLTLIRKEQENPPILSANFAEEMLVTKDNCHYCEVDSTEYAVRVAFHIYDSVTDVTFWSMVMEENFQKDEALFQMDAWDPEKPLVVDVAFPGDMTMYAISFTDSQGNAHTYTIGISGRNGSLILKPFEDLKESQ